MDLYLRLLRFLAPHRVRLAGAILATLVFAGATSLYAFLLGPLLKMLLAGGSQSTSVPLLGSVPQRHLLAALPLLLIAAAAVRAVAQGLQIYWMQTAGQRIVATLRRSLYARFLALPQAWFVRNHSGDLLSRFGADVQAVEFLLTWAFASYVKDSLTLIVLLGACAWLDWRLFVAAVAVVPLAGWPLAKFARHLKGVSDASQAALGTLAGQVGETVANVRIVQAYCRESDELERFDRAQGGFLRLMRRSFLLRAAFTPVAEMAAVLGLAAALAFAGSAIAAGRLSGETLLSFVAALMLMYQPIKSLSGTGQMVVQGMSGARRVFEVLDAPDRLPEAASPAPARFERQLALRDVTFAYAADAVLKGLSLEVKRGETVALVGESGSGKSTVAALLLRFWDPQQGAVELDGQDVRGLRLADLRALFAYVPQEPVLFAGSVRDNVGCARPGATDAEVTAALEAASAWEFVRTMDGGLDATIGERGTGLSGGQRQRLALARAFLADAPIIVLDEATSALDNASEALVQQGLERLLAHRTAIVIAHRLTTIERADRIVVLANGRVVEQGTHRELSARDGVYAALWAAQAAPAPAPAPAPARAAGS